MKATVSLAKQEAEIEASQKEVVEFLGNVIPEFVKEGGGILSDTFRFWRWKNQVNIIKKAKDKVEKSGLAANQVPLKVLLPIIEKSSLEEEKNIQEKWASLLANAITASRDISPNYADILSELSSVEVSVLDILFAESSKELDLEKRKKMQFSKGKIMELLSMNNDQADLMIENFYRLNLCQPPASHGGVSLGEYPIIVRTNDFFELTTFGYHFVQACKFLPISGS